ncbi:hypothetical protein LSH36_190g00050 [Paralvinella palmiformis]|uniref:protein-tyrosine-phosphatase n=1 Tax=Paralvinella palmiformis TaxID=53620 RepID=A0AAD9N6N7_9ANNE|nr:hypothetical protein LSH36_190g00050 [Paralvinella palmiformis]
MALVFSCGLILIVVVNVKCAQNLALGKPANQTGMYDNLSADRAVDGGYGSDNGGQYYCAHPYNKDYKPAEWWVDLQDTYLVDNVIIYNTYNSGGYFRLTNFIISVRHTIDTPGTDCGESYTDTVPLGGNVTITCHIRGRFVHFRRVGGGEEWLVTLCEVEVYGRKEIDCSRCPNNIPCNGVTGCSQCEAGKLPPDCVRDCPDTTYGLNCSSQCGKCRYNPICNKSNGYCSPNDGCQLWFDGQRCDVEVVPASPTLTSVQPESSNTNTQNIKILYQTETHKIFHLEESSININLCFIFRKKKRKPTIVILNDGTSNVAFMPSTPSPKLKMKQNFMPQMSTKPPPPPKPEHPDTTTSSNKAAFTVPEPVDVSQFDAYVKNKKRNMSIFSDEYKTFPPIDKSRCKLAVTTTNKAKNRFANIYAYMRMTILSHVRHIEYFQLQGYHGPKEYIATQGPKSHTAVDLWRMIWQENVNRIVMLANLVDDGKNETRKVRQFHFTSWEDKNKPLNGAITLFAFFNKVHSFDRMSTGPMLVHCSAGVGRTGTFIAFDILTKQAAEENKEQYIFLHNALDEYFKCGNTSYPCNNFLETFGTISTPSDDLGGISELDRQYNVKYKL